MNKTTVDANLSDLAHREVESVMAMFKDVSAVVVSTQDGFDIASSVKPGSHADAGKVAAMASSIAAIGSVVAKETVLGGCKSISINAADGFMLITSIPRKDLQLILSVVAGRDTVPAQIVVRSRQSAKALLEGMQEVGR